MFMLVVFDHVRVYFIGVSVLVFDHVRVYWCVHACGVSPRESLLVCSCLWCLTT